MKNFSITIIILAIIGGAVYMLQTKDENYVEYSSGSGIFTLMYPDIWEVLEAGDYGVTFINKKDQGIAIVANNNYKSAIDEIDKEYTREDISFGSNNFSKFVMLEPGAENDVYLLPDVNESNYVNVIVNSNKGFDGLNELLESIRVN